MKTTKLWLRNTSHYPDAEIWPLVRCAYESVERSLTAGEVMPKVIVKFTNCRYGYRGMASWTEWEYADKSNMWGDKTCWQRILVRLGNAKHFPHLVNYSKFKDMPEYECRTYREAAVMVTAHEMQHALGTGGKRRGEFLCEMVAWDAIDYYRKHQAEVDQEITDGLGRIEQRKLVVASRQEQTKRPEVQVIKKLKATEDALARWQRKQRVAANKVKKYARALKRYQKRMLELNTPAATEPLPLAATPPPAS